MANRPAAPLLLREGDREKLTRLVHSASVRAGLAQRARIVLLASGGVSNTEIAEQVGATRTTVIAWRARYAAAGIAGLADHDRSGLPRPIDQGDRGRHPAVAAEEARGQAVVLPGVGCPVGDRPQRIVAKPWREYGIAPWREGTFKFSTDPEMVAKVVDVVGLYLALPENAIVLCVDVKSQIQALERTAPGLLMQPDRPAACTHKYIRHGISPLFAALEIATGHVTAACRPRHRRQDFLAFLRQVARA